MYELHLNTEERNALLALLDLAVKGGGMQVAEAAVVLSKKITETKPAAPALSVVDTEQGAA